MKVTASPPSPVGKPSTPAHKVVDTLKAGIRWLDDYTSPRPHTAGNFAKASYFQSALQGGTEGFYLLGLPGVLTGAGSAMLGVCLDRATRGRKWVSIPAGAVAGAAGSAAVAALVGGPMGIPAAAIAGGLLGAFQTFRADARSAVRDAGGNATMISAAFLPGPAKMAGGLGAAVGAQLKSRPLKALVGAATGAALGAGLAAVGFAPVGVATAAAGSALAGALGPFVGPRFSQFFRNLSEDLGKGAEKLAHRLGWTHGNLDEKVRNAAGSVPSSFVKEGLRGFLFSDGSPVSFLLGGVMESLQQAHIMLFQESPGEPNSDATPPLAGAPGRLTGRSPNPLPWGPAAPPPGPGPSPPGWPAAPPGPRRPAPGWCR